MKNIILVLFILLVLCGCKDDSVVSPPPVPLPEITTPTVASDTIIVNSYMIAFLKGTVVSDGGSVIIDRGFCWSTLQGPTVSASNTIRSGTGKGTFQATITGLSSGSGYYVRAFGTNKKGTAYGSEKYFVTPAYPHPIVSISASTDSIFGGQSATITWTSKNTYSCTGIGFNTNNATAGTILVSPSVTTIYSVIGYGLGGIDTATVNIIIKPETIGLGNPYQDGIIYWIDNTGQHGMIAKQGALSDWETANKGIPGWSLPTIEILTTVYERKEYLSLTYQDGDPYFWSSTLPPGPDSLEWAQILNFNTGPEPGSINVGFKTNLHNVVFIKPF